MIGASTVSTLPISLIIDGNIGESALNIATIKLHTDIIVSIRLGPSCSITVAIVSKTVVMTGTSAVKA